MRPRDHLRLACSFELPSGIILGKNFSREATKRWTESIKTFPYYLTDFLKTNLRKVEVIWLKRHPKACFLSPRSSKITVTKEKERRKRKSEDKERRRREKSNGCTLSFYNGCFGDCFWPKKHFWTEKVHLAVTFPKMTVDEPKFNIQNNRTSHAFTCYKWPPPIGDDSCIQNTKIFTVKAFHLEPLVNNHHL